MMYLSTLLFIICICLEQGSRCTGADADGANQFHHQAPDQHKLSAGWQEPGLWRPLWVMDRTFDADEALGTSAKEDRIYFKLKSDRTIKVMSSKNRPLLEIFKPKVEKEKKKKLFETEEDNSEESRIEEENSKKVKRTSEDEQAQIDFDGTWWWQDASPMNGAKVKIETREGADKQERIRHDGLCEWGSMDGYSALFKIGKILKYKMTEAGVPLGTYQAGNYIIRVNTHRPLVGKEFLAFE